MYPSTERSFLFCESLSVAVDLWVKRYWTARWGGSEKPFTGNAFAQNQLLGGKLKCRHFEWSTPHKVIPQLSSIGRLCPVLLCLITERAYFIFDVFVCLEANWAQNSHLRLTVHLWRSSRRLLEKNYLNNRSENRAICDSPNPQQKKKSKKSAGIIYVIAWELCAVPERFYRSIYSQWKYFTRGVNNCFIGSIMSPFRRKHHRDGRGTAGNHDLKAELRLALMFALGMLILTKRAKINCAE